MSIYANYTKHFGKNSGSIGRGSVSQWGEIRANIRVNGIVQGVGFRPFVHRQMKKYSLCGWVRNTSDGVEIEAEGRRISIEEFIHALKYESPALSRLEAIKAEYFDEILGYEDIKILTRGTADLRNTLISPDVATCPDCLMELFDTNDRRHGFPFINCTNCGPRFSIIRDVP